MMKSSIDRANDSNAAARMPGRISGKVTFQNVRTGDAPRSWAACSSVQSKPRTLARTVRATKLTWNITWAMITVVKPRVMSASRNNVASDDAEDDLGRRQRQDEEDVESLRAAEPVAGEGDGDHRADDGGDRRRDGGDLEALDEGVGERPVR